MSVFQIMPSDFLPVSPHNSGRMSQVTSTDHPFIHVWIIYCSTIATSNHHLWSILQRLRQMHGLDFRAPREIGNCAR
jgi:hypothetical protein